MLFGEHILKNLDSKIFYKSLLEYITKTDKIKHANHYWKLENPHKKFDKGKMTKYAKEFPISDIKDDIHDFVTEFSKRLLQYVDIIETKPNNSTEFGFSDYIFITFKKPENPDLYDFYANNKKLYDHVKVRFSDHKESSKVPQNKKSVIKVNLYNRTFLDCAQEMETKVLDYVRYLRTEEEAYLSKLHPLTNCLYTKLIKLKINEGVILDERLEEISTATYATDSVGDIVNWLLNKPKPYRILYDREYDVWVIADAMSNTHKDMSIDLFDSDYLYGVAKDLDGDISLAREDGKFNSGYTDAEVYSNYWFHNYQLKGLFFIPKNMQYRDYEESGFYSHEVPITTGSLFVQRPSEFSEHGIFKDLYNKLDRLNALKSSLKSIYLDCRKNYGLDWLQYFYDEAEEWDYDEDEIQEFLDRYGIVGTLKEV